MTAPGDGPWRRTLAAGTLLIVAVTLPAFLVASLAPRIDRELGLSAVQLGVAIGLYYVVSALAAGPAGRLVDRLGPARGLRAAVALGTAAPLAIAVLAHSTAVLAALLAVNGLANALVSPSASALVSHHVPLDRRGVTLGAQQSGAPLGAVAAGLALPLVAVPLGWRWAFAGAAALMLLSGWAMQRGRAEQRPAATAPAAAGRRPPAAAGAAPGGTVWLLAGGAALANAAAVGAVSFLVVYAVDAGLAPGPAGALLAGCSLAAAAARVALGRRADRGGGRRLPQAAAMMLLGAAGFGLLAVGAPAAVVAGALLVGGVGWGWPGLLILEVVTLRAHAPGAAVGVAMTGIFVGACVGPLAIGLVVERATFAAAWLACAALLVAAAGVFALAARRTPATAGA